jgi:hypothetical protein
MRKCLAAHRVFLALWGTLLASATTSAAVFGAACLPLVALALIMPPLVGWSSSRPVPEPYDWPVWSYWLYEAVRARIGIRRDPWTR